MIREVIGRRTEKEEEEAVLVDGIPRFRRVFAAVDREWKRERGGEGSKNEMSPPCHCPRRVPYTEGRYRGGGSPPLRIVYRRRFKKGMTFYRAARSISRGMEGGPSFLLPPPRRGCKKWLSADFKRRFYRKYTRANSLCAEFVSNTNKYVSRGYRHLSYTRE